MVTVPESFLEDLQFTAGSGAQEWLDQLPGLIDDLCAQWQLQIDGAPSHGGLALVVPVRRGGQECVLKVSSMDTGVECEGLRAWDGRGTVRLLDARPEANALLLERLNSERSLADVPIDEAVTAAGELIRRLAVLPPAGLADLPSPTCPAGEEWEAVPEAIPPQSVDMAQRVCREFGPHSAQFLLNGDLHYENVLSGEREPWLVIDPMVMVGDPEYSAGRLLYRRLEDAGVRHKLRLLRDSGGLDEMRLYGWSLVHVLRYWIWGLGVGLTEDPERCAAVCEQLLEWNGW